MHLNSADTNHKCTFGYIRTIFIFLRVWCCHFVQFFGHAYGTMQLGSELIGHCHMLALQPSTEEQSKDIMNSQAGPPST